MADDGLSKVASTPGPEEADRALAAQVGAWEARLSAAESNDAFLLTWQSVATEVNGLASAPSGYELLEGVRARKLRGRLAPFQRRYLALAEASEAEALLGLSGRSEGGFRCFLRSDFGRNTFDRLEEAARLVSLEGCSRIAVVGCGALPAAALFFHERAPEARIEALDIDSQAVDRARRVAELHCPERLEILCEDGCEHDYGSADLIYVVNQVAPKSGVLRRIAATARPEVPVLLRDPVGPGRLLADSVGDSLPSGWGIAAAGSPNPNFFSRHLLLIRHPRHATDGALARVSPRPTS